MKRVLVFIAMLCVPELASAANSEQCAAIFQDKDSREMCEAVSSYGTKLSNEELREKVRAVFAEIAAGKKQSDDANAKRDAAKAKLESDSKSNALRLKGLYPGITLEKADEYHPGIADFCREKGVPPDSLFNCVVTPSGRHNIDTLYTLAGKDVKGWTFNGKGNVIWRILVLLSTDSAMEVGAALAEKYKFGTFSIPTVTNRMGASFENVTRTWKSNDLTLVVKRYGSSIDDGSIVFISTREPKLKEAPNTKDL